MEITDLRPGNWISYQDLEGYNYRVISAETTEFGDDIITVRSRYTGELETLLAFAFYPIYIENRVDIRKGPFIFYDNGFIYDTYEDAYIYTDKNKEFKVYIYTSQHTLDGTAIVYIEKYPDNWDDMTEEEQDEYIEQTAPDYTKNLLYIHELQNFLEDSGVDVNIELITK